MKSRLDLSSLPSPLAGEGEGEGDFLTDTEATEAGSDARGWCWSVAKITLHSRDVGLRVLDQAARGMEERAGVQPVVLVDDQIPQPGASTSPG